MAPCSQDGLVATTARTGQFASVPDAASQLSALICHSAGFCSCLKAAKRTKGADVSRSQKVKAFKVQEAGGRAKLYERPHDRTIHVSPQPIIPALLESRHHSTTNVQAGSSGSDCQAGSVVRAEAVESIGVNKQLGHAPTCNRRRVQSAFPSANRLSAPIKIKVGGSRSSFGPISQAPPAQSGCALRRFGRETWGFAEDIRSREP